jgi:ABC-type polysaccharide/polyol phosphate transport system ATPase subunit
MNEPTNEIVIELNDVSFSYRPVKKVSLVWGGTFSQKHRKYMPHPPAINHVDLKLFRGKKIGIVGKNGAGKTTLLRIMAGIYRPDSGKVIINSKSVSLVSLGVGFEFNATGIENIYLSTLLSGLTKSEVNRYIDEIIQFSELGDFINYPIKTYSTGMRSKLAFSIAVHTNPEVLLLDEVLSVGDYGFQQKSLRKMQELIQEKNRTVILASHSLQTLTDICDEVVWMDQGKVLAVGEPLDILKKYQQSFAK